MAEKPEDPERVSRPPIGLVTIKDDRRLRGYAIPGSELRERIGRDVVALHGIIEVRAPVDMNGIRNMTGGIEQDVFVALDDAYVRVIEMLGEPGGFDETFGAGVCAHGEELFDFLFSSFVSSSSGKVRIPDVPVLPPACFGANSERSSPS